MPRATLAVPVDVTRAVDTTISDAQISADTVLNSTDDIDTITSFIEDAEDEFRAQTDDAMRVSRAGVAGQRETYETVTYDVSGHQAYKRNWSGVTADYRATEVTTGLNHNRILPFDSADGDACYIYRGLSGSAGTNQWEDITADKGDLWDILDYQGGRLVLHPVELHRAMHHTTQGLALGGAGRLREVRLAISYRYGGLGGSRGRATKTDLSASLTDSQTGTISVSDGSGFPLGGETIVVLIDGEYLSVRPDPANDQMEVLARGVRGTTAASHSSGDTLYYTPPSVRKAVASKAGIAMLGASQYQDWLPDTESSLDKGDVIDELQSVWDATIAALS